MIEEESNPIDRQLSILYIDDEMDFLVLAKLFLERTGYFKVRILTSAREALESCNIGEYDAIISDYLMPDIDGISFLKEVRSRYGDIPFILFTGRSHESVAIDTINSGGDYYIRKSSEPIEMFEDLTDKILKSVRKKTPTQSIRDSERHLFDIIDFIPDATFAINLQGEVVAWNRAIEELTGVSFRDIIGRGDYDYAIPFYGYRRPLLINLINEPIQKIEDYYFNVHWVGNSLIAETDLKNPKGHKLSGLIKVCKHYNSNGEVIGAIEIIQNLTDLKKTEEELRVNKKLIRDLTKTSFDRIYNLNKIRRYLTDAMDLAQLVNWEYDIINDEFIFDERFFSMYGTTAEREGGNRMASQTYAREFLHPKDLHLVAEEIKKVKQNTHQNYVRQIEHRIIRRDGQVRHIIVRYAILQDETGKTIGTYGVNQDITERKLAEIALKRSEERFLTVTRNAGSWIWEINPEGLFTYSSPVIEDILGYKPEELVDIYHFYDLFAPDVCEDLKKAITETFQSRKPLKNFINQNIHKNGSTIILSTCATPIFDEDGEFIGYSGVNEDITERKKTEKALTESETKFRDIFNNANDFIIIHDMNGKFLEVNKVICRKLKYSYEELMNLSVWDVEKSDYHQLVKSRFEKMRESGQLVFETLLIAKDETTIPTEVNSRIIIINGEPAIISIGRDVTERKQAENALRQANRQINLLTSITRHDILNKVSIIFTYLDAAKLNPEISAIQENLEKIEYATTAIRSQIEFTRIYEDLGINKPLWQELISVMPISDLGSMYNFIPDVNGYSIFADPMLKKVFSNLLDNSLRHGGHVSKIHVSAKICGNNLKIIWEDNGIGITDEDKEIIFERGFGSNTGLGMFLIREILSLTGISIHETGEYGKGVRFEILVPKSRWMSV